MFSVGQSSLGFAIMIFQISWFRRDTHVWGLHVQRRKAFVFQLTIVYATSQIRQVGGGGGESGVYSAFNHTWSKNWLQVGVGGVCRCMRGDLMWTCLVWADDLRPTIFLVPIHRFNYATGQQKGITQTIYTDSEQPSRMPNSLMPSAKLRSENLPFFTSLVWCGRDRTPASRTPSGRSNHYATRGRSSWTGLHCIYQCGTC